MKRKKKNHDERMDGVGSERQHMINAERKGRTREAKHTVTIQKGCDEDAKVQRRIQCPIAWLMLFVVSVSSDQTALL